MRGHLELQMYVVRPDVALKNFDIVRAANFADQVTDFDRDVPANDRLAILRAEHEVVVQLIDGMGGSAIRFHAHNVSQAP